MSDLFSSLFNAHRVRENYGMDDLLNNPEVTAQWAGFLVATSSGQLVFRFENGYGAICSMLCLRQ